MATTDESAIRHELRSLAEQYRAASTDETTSTGSWRCSSPTRPSRSTTRASPPSRVRSAAPSDWPASPTSIQRYPKTFHMLGQSTYSIGERRGTGEVYCIAHHLTSDQPLRRELAAPTT